MTETIDGIEDNAVWEMAEKAVSTGAQVVSAGTVANIFTITGGPIEVTALVGEFTTAIHNTACNLKLTMDPTNGADTDMCTVVNIQAATQYSWIHLDGTEGNAAVIGVPGTDLPLGVGMDVPLILPPGTVDMSLSSSPTSGAITWYLRYKPLKTGITVTGKA